MYQCKQRDVIITYIISFIAYTSLWYLCNDSFKNGDLGISNIICMAVSFCFFVLSIESFRKGNVKCYSVFSLVYFGTLLLNTLNISGYQTAKDIEDVYYFLLGGCIFYIFLYIGEQIRILPFKYCSVVLLSKETLFRIIISSYLILTAINFLKNGIPILGGAYSPDVLNIYKEGGISGICMVLSFLSLIIATEMKKNNPYIIYATILIIEGVLKFSRGNIFRILLFLFFVFIFNIVIEKNYKRYIKYVIPIILVIILGFGMLGNLRTNMRGENTGGSVTLWINSYIDTNVDLGVFAWIYGYTVINFDTVKMVYNQTETESFSTIYTPFFRLVKGTEILKEYTHDHSLNADYINSGFSKNAMKVFIAPYISDMGMLFWGELSIVGAIYALFVWYAKTRRHKGLYCYIMMLVSLCVCGNYVFIRTYLYVILGALLFFSVTKNRRDICD